MALGGSPSMFGIVIGAGGLNTVPTGWIDTMKRGCWPNPGAIGTLSPLTPVTETHPVFVPPGKVADPGSTVNANPGDCGSVNVPPCVASTQSRLTVSRAGR